MKRLVLTLLFIPVLLSAKSKPSPEQKALEKLLELAGGPARFERLTTLTCDFEETVQTSTGVSAAKGRFFFRMHDEAGFRAREERSDGGARVERASAPGEGGRLMGEFFWLFVVQRIKEEGRPLEFLPRATFLGRLLDRLSVGGEPFFPGGEDLVLYLHPDSGALLGAAYGRGPTLAAFLPSVTTASQLVVPAGRVYHDASGKPFRTVKVSNIIVNGYVDEALFAQGATP